MTNHNTQLHLKIQYPKPYFPHCRQRGSSCVSSLKDQSDKSYEYIVQFTLSQNWFLLDFGAFGLLNNGFAFVEYNFKTRRFLLIIGRIYQFIIILTKDVLQFERLTKSFNNKPA